ncbi:MAG: hypothetical protein EGQ94_10040 [Ruminococcus sp.]|nr:hypothetical protein [Ruminococcus sp.]
MRFLQCWKMFFRNTHVAHKTLKKPYFIGFAVLQAIIDCSDYIKMVQKARKIKAFRAFAISKRADMV